MEDNKEKKSEIRAEMAQKIDALTREEKQEKYTDIGDKLFEFANFMESRIVLLYITRKHEVETKHIVDRCFDYSKIVVLPVKGTDQFAKIDNPAKDLRVNAEGMIEPDADRCKMVPVESIDIAIIPGLAFDEKGGRVGTGGGFYDQLIPKLPITTRKVALALEMQILPQVPMESHDKYVDIIVTEERIIYKI